LIRFNPPETYQPATQHPNTSAPQNLQAKTATDSQSAASKTSQLAGHNKKTASKISGKKISNLARRNPSNQTTSKQKNN
jgi:hypothetical protein